MLLLLLMHSAKSLNAQEERPVTSPEMVTRLHLPHAIDVRLHVVRLQAMDFARSAPQGAHYHADVIYLLP